jgi:hypothetical protein
VGVEKGVSTDVAARIEGLLVGHSLIEVERSEFDWLFRFANNVGLRVSCPWRIVVDGRIAYGDCNHAQQFGLPRPIDGAERSINLLRDKTIQGVVIRNDVGDLAIAFSDVTTMEVLNTSSGYEGWQLADGTGWNVVAMGGGQLAIWAT